MASGDIIVTVCDMGGEAAGGKFASSSTTCDVTDSTVCGGDSTSTADAGSDFMHPADLMQQIKTELYEHKYCRISQSEMLKLMSYLGATGDDIEGLGAIFDDASKRKDPAHNKYVNSRMHIFDKASDDEHINKTWSTRQFIPHTSIVITDDTYKNGNGGLGFRPFGKMADWMLGNTALDALLKITLENLKPDSNVDRKGGRNDEHKYVIETAIQQVDVQPEAAKTTADKDRAFTSSPEGIHMDGCDVVLVLFHSIKNVAKDQTSETFVFDTKVESGYHSNEKHASSTIQDHVISQFRMNEDWEGVLMLDQEIKHEARGRLIPIDERQRAYRNVITIHARRPHANGDDDAELRMGRQFAKPAEEASIVFKAFDRVQELDGKFFPIWQNFISKNSEELITQFRNRVEAARRHPTNTASMDAYEAIIDELKNIELMQPIKKEFQEQKQEK